MPAMWGIEKDSEERLARNQPKNSSWKLKSHVPHVDTNMMRMHWVTFLGPEHKDTFCEIQLKARRCQTKKPRSEKLVLWLSRRRIPPILHPPDDVINQAHIPASWQRRQRRRHQWQRPCRTATPFLVVSGGNLAIMNVDGLFLSERCYTYLARASSQVERWRASTGRVSPPAIPVLYLCCGVIHCRRQYCPARSPSPPRKEHFHKAVD